MAETKVSNEVPTVVGVEDKCRSEMSSCEDLPKPECNGTGDLDNSYVFVTGDDGLPDDTVGDKDAVVGGSNVSPESKAVVAEDQVAKLDPENEELDPENEELDPDSEELDPESEKLDTVSREILVEAEVKLLKDPDGNMAEAVVDKVVDQNGKIKGVAADEQEKLDDLMESDSSSSPVENQVSQIRALGLVTESEEIGDSGNGNLVDSSVSEKDGFQDQIDLSSIGTLKAYQGSEGVVVNVVGSDLQDVITEAKDEVKLEREVVKTAEDEVPTSTSLDLDLESCPIDDKEETVMEESIGKEESNIISSNTNDAGNANDECEEEINLSVTEAAEASEGSKDVVVNVADSEVQDVSTETKDEVKLEGGVVDTAEFEVPLAASLDLDLELNQKNEKEETLGQESGEKEELNIISSNINTFGNANGESDGQINLSGTETPGACQGYEDVGVDVVECALQDVGMGAEDDVKLEREVVETVEHEAPPSTSLDLDLKSYTPNNKEETLQEEPADNGELSIILPNINLTGKATDECEDLVNLRVSDVLEASQGSKDVVVNVAECDLQDVNMETRDEIKLEREVVETAEHGVLESTSSDLELEPRPINNKEENVEEEATTTLSSAVVQSQQCNSALDNNVPGVLEPMDEAKTVLSNTDCHMEPVGDLVLDEKSKEDLSVLHGDNGVQNLEVPDKHIDGSGVSSETSLSETKTEASVPTQSFPASNDYQPQIENEISDAETIGAVSSSSVDGPKSQVVEGAFPDHDSSIMSNINEASSGSGSTLDTVVLTEKEPTSRGGETHGETEVLSEKAKAADSPPETFDVKLEPANHIHDVSTVSSVEAASSVTLACRTEVSDNFDVKKEATNIVLEIRDVEDMVDQLDGAAGISNDNLSLQENEDTKNSSSNNISVSERRDVEDMVDQLDGAAGISDENLSLQENEDTEHSSSNNVSVASLGCSLIDGEAAIIKTKATPFNFLVRVPRFDDESLREQIRLAKLHVDEKTKLREAMQFQIQDKRANSQVHGIDYEYAKAEARSARKLVRSKRVEIDSLQSVINKAKNALSIEDIDSQIYNMEHMIQHETLPLKEEKQLIREIKQLKQLREQLSSNMGSHDEVKQALEQREEVEERLKILRKELDVLKGRVLKAEAVAVEAEKKYGDENKKVRELQTQFRAADDVRQAAYAQWQNLRKELSEKTKHFFKYKDNAALANNYAFTRDTEALYRLCFHNVENFMELWNTSEEFRMDYVKFNARSYVRRFGTSDGRSLGPDEEPLALPSYVGDRVKMVPTPVKVDDLTSQIATRELKQEPTVEDVISEDKTVKKVMENKNPKVTNKEPTIHIHSNGLDSDSARDITDEVQEEPKKSKDEIEAIRKAEEMRKEEIEAKLKKERRLEALAKANEARERKKRQAEKLQMRAELKTKKEAEQKEKEREKRLRKKERKKAATDVNDIETAPSSETASEISNDTEVKDTSSSSVAPKKPQKSWLFAKQSKAKSVVPPALRNRNKKRLHQWIWVVVTSLVILLLFWLGNMGVFSSVHYKRRNPVH